MSQAIFMLNNTDKGVTEIALQSGFASASYFIMKFKEKMGITPFAYKKYGTVVLGSASSILILNLTISTIFVISTDNKR